MIPGLGRSPGGENGNPLHYSCLENPMDTGAWWATVHGSQRIGHDLETNKIIIIERERESQLLVLEMDVKNLRK